MGRSCSLVHQRRRSLGLSSFRAPQSMPGYSSFVQKRGDIECEQVALTTGQVKGKESLGISPMCIACSNQFHCLAKKNNTGLSTPRAFQCVLAGEKKHARALCGTAEAANREVRPRLGALCALRYTSMPCSAVAKENEASGVDLL